MGNAIFITFPTFEQIRVLKYTAITANRLSDHFHFSTFFLRTGTFFKNIY